MAELAAHLVDGVLKEYTVVPMSARPRSPLIDSTSIESPELAADQRCVDLGSGRRDCVEIDDGCNAAVARRVQV